MDFVSDTVNTTRISIDDPILFSVNVSRMVYASDQKKMRPSAVILVPVKKYHYSYIAASLVHTPINGSFLFTDEDAISPVTLDEIIRLAPTEKNAPAQVILVGPLGRTVEEVLHQHGFTTLRIGSADVFETACEATQFRLVRVPPKGKVGNRNIIVASADDGSEALPTAYFAAHSGVPIIFVNRDSVPKNIKWLIKEFSDRTYTLFGSEKTLSKRVEKEIKGIADRVERIDGDDPFEISVKFAKRQGSEKDIGWDRNKQGAGDAFTFGTIKAWRKTVAGLLLAHNGKHTPLLLIHPERIPKVVREYLLKLNPTLTEPPKPPFMHGFILGNYGTISYSTQVELEEHLTIGAGDNH